MELVLAVLGAGPIGYFSPTRRIGVLIYLAAWVVVFIDLIMLTVVGGKERTEGEWRSLLADEVAPSGTDEHDGTD